MAARLLIVARNDQLPTVHRCPNCNGWGYDYTQPFNPSAKPYKVVCADCGGEGFLTTSPAPSPASSPARGNLARPLPQVVGRAISNTGITPGSGTAAELRLSEEDTQQHSTLTRPVSAAAGIGLLTLVDDALRVGVGLLVFSAIALFFWVLA